MKMKRKERPKKMNSKIYKQADSRWGSLPYPTKKSTFSGNGCGCCACLHDLIELDKYKDWTPKELRPYMVDQGFAVAGKGTLWSGITKTLQHYGFSVINHPTMANIFATLDQRKKKGQPCIGVILFSSGSRGGITWTASGHFVAYVDYKVSGNKHYFYTKDSGGRNHDGWYCYETQMKGLIPQIWSALSSAQAAAEAVVKVAETLKRLTVDGIGGEQTILASQRFLKTFEDGIVSGQDKSYKKYYTSITAVMYGKGGSTFVKALQVWLGVTKDGVLGPATTKAWQKKLRDLGYLAKTETIDGIFGPKSMKAWQEFLNDQLFPESKDKDDGSYKVIDVSYVQKNIDWAKVKASGIKGAIVRCGYRGYESGKLNTDDRFLEHIKGAHAAGLKVGVYFFTEGISAAEGKEEAAYTLNLVKTAGIPLSFPIAIDTEHINAKNVRANGLSKAKRTEVIKAFCEEIKRQGYEPMIYASLLWFRDNLDMSQLPYKIWCAQYYSKCEYKGEYILWQYTSEGKVNGISGAVDMNHCYIKETASTTSKEASSTASTSTAAAVSTVAALSIEELAKQVLEGKWGSGADRKANLTKAGYDYDKVQAKVNEMLANKVLTREEVIANMNAWAKKIAADNSFHYKKWKDSDAKTKECPICKNYPKDKAVSDPAKIIQGHHGWNCIGFAWAVWHHGGGLPTKCNCHVISNEVGEQIAKAKTDAEALKIVKSKAGIKDVTVIRNNGKNIPKKKWKAGDICLKFSGDEYIHMFYYMGDGKVADSTGSNGKVANDKQIAIRNYTNYSARVIIRWTGGQKAEETPAPTEKKKYTGELPSTKLVKTNAQVIADAIAWAKWIAGDNDFHYGYGKEAHHNGCYFCGTEGKLKKGKGIVDYEHTYCCNPFVGAAWAHGGCVPKALELCRKCSSWDFGKGGGYNKSSLFTNLGKPDKSKLKAGDVLCSDTHVALYIGGGKIAEASGGDDNKKGSEKWNNSIHIANLTDAKYKKFKRVHRFNSSVNTTCAIYHGEVSDRVKLLQKFLIWYGLLPKGSDDGIFGDKTLAAVKAFQKAAGITVDGIVGPNTIAAMAKAVK